jgi:glycosyltransferase involved in cell wall biosynthesis
VIDCLARGLVDAGHEVLLVATGDSTCPVDRRWVYDVAPEPMGSTLPELDHVAFGYDELAGCDVIHDHTLSGPVWAATVRDRPPVLATNHGEFSPPVRRIFAHLAGAVTINAISHNQAATAPDVPITAVIHHGLDLDRFTVGAGQGGYAIFIGRCTPDKGVDRAIEIARRAGVPIKLVAKKREAEERRYFDERVAPLLGPGVEYLGEVHPDERDRLLQGALALVNPISWPEPFGLVMAESLACGTPVVGYPAGAAPEIVDDGVTGFLCHDIDSAATALAKVGSLDRGACRAAIEERFSSKRMVADYLALYASLASS